MGITDRSGCYSSITLAIQHQWTVACKTDKSNTKQRRTKSPAKLAWLRSICFYIQFKIWLHAPSWRNSPLKDNQSTNHGFNIKAAIKSRLSKHPVSNWFICSSVFWTGSIFFLLLNNFHHISCSGFNYFSLTSLYAWILIKTFCVANE